MKRCLQKEIYLVGPTAAGKSKVALYLAQKLDGEILSADSMQVYQGFPIATDQPSERDMNEIIHHMVGRIDPSVHFSVYEYLSLANKCLEDIHQKNKFAIIVGGSGLYIKALMDGMFEDPEMTSPVAEKLKCDYETLKEVDPLAAEKIDPNNKRRIERAINFYNKTGLKISSMQTQWDQNLILNSKINYFGLSLSREEVIESINKRVDDMIERGLEKEAYKIFNDKNKNITLMQAIGLKEFFDYFENNISYEEVVSNIKIHSRQLAKKQRTWFNKDKRVKWVDIHKALEIKDIGDRILQLMNFI